MKSLSLYVEGGLTDCILLLKHLKNMSPYEISPLGEGLQNLLLSSYGFCAGGYLIMPHLCQRLKQGFLIKFICCLSLSSLSQKLSNQELEYLDNFFLKTFQLFQNSFNIAGFQIHPSFKETLQLILLKVYTFIYATKIQRPWEKSHYNYEIRKISCNVSLNERCIWKPALLNEI